MPITANSMTIEGKTIDLIPITEEHLGEIVRIRNQPNNAYFFNQNFVLTLEMQQEWFEKYLQRDDDIYWGIFSKNGILIGTKRLYSITESQCEEGSTMLDGAYSMSGPYAAESFLLSLRFAFDKLKVDKVINDIRCDNKNMNSIAKKIGFQKIGKNDIRGVEYYRNELTNKDFNETLLRRIVDLWLERA